MSINVPDVIESLRASCTGSGMSMTEVAMSVVAMRRAQDVILYFKPRSGTRCGRGRPSLASNMDISNRCVSLVN